MKGINRTIIIPRGTLNSDDVNVVVVPRSLQNTSQPLIVKPAPGNRLAVQSLPIWGDELDSAPSSQKRANFDDEATQEPDEVDVFEASDFETSIMCTSVSEDAPQLMHVSSKTVTVSNDGPPEVFEVTFDASEGVDANIFETVLEQSMSRNKTIDEEFLPQEVSSLDDFNPPFNSTSLFDESYADFDPNILNTAITETPVYYQRARPSPPGGRSARGSGGCPAASGGCGGSCSAGKKQSRSAYYDYPNYAQQVAQKQHSGRRRQHRSHSNQKSGCGSAGCAARR